MCGDDVYQAAGHGVGGREEGGTASESLHDSVFVSPGHRASGAKEGRGGEGRLTSSQLMGGERFVAGPSSGLV